MKISGKVFIGVILTYVTAIFPNRFIENAAEDAIVDTSLDEVNK